MDARLGGGPIVIPSRLGEMTPDQSPKPEPIQSDHAAPVGDTVLLCGGLYPAPLTRACDRSLLDLTIAPNRTLISHWDARLEEAGLFCSSRQVVMLHTKSVPAPHPTPDHASRFVDVTEPDTFRGPAGALRDTVGQGDDGAFVLVLEANRYQAEPLNPLLRWSTRDDVDVVIACNADHSPGGAYLIRRSVLALVPPLGFMDLKEQLIGKALDAGARVELAEYAGMGSERVRTRRDILHVACRHAAENGRVEPPLSIGSNPMVLAQSTWASVISDQAEVDRGAVLVESIVMDGAKIAAGAVVVRSVVCPGGEVEAGHEVVDAIVTPDGVRYDADEAVVRFQQKRKGQSPKRTKA